MSPGGYLLGYDIGSSSVKATMLDIHSGVAVASASSPDREMPISAPRPGWAEQHPDQWWTSVREATGKVALAANADLCDVRAVGISYQMHGLVMVDKSNHVIRPAIIWCDSRAVETGARALKSLGEKRCLFRLLNSPGNFTASKLKWVKDHEPKAYRRLHRFMLPGDWLALQLTGRATTTVAGLSEGILWDFPHEQAAAFLLNHYGIDASLIPELVPTFGMQGVVSSQAASVLGLKAGIPVSYRAGDQPNNAFSLNVLHPGEVAATAGTSGVVYGVLAEPRFDPKSRVNTFVHVNHTSKAPRYGVLLCVNGTGILNSWLKHNLAGTDYREMDRLAASVPPGSDGLQFLPFGNGSERTLQNEDIGAVMAGLRFPIHTRAHLLRAAQEGIVLALNHGLAIMRATGVKTRTVRAGHANMFLSPVFGQTFSTVTNTVVELYNTDGSQGAARGAGLGAGIYPDATSAFGGLSVVRRIEPDGKLRPVYRRIVDQWEELLHKHIAARRS